MLWIIKLSLPSLPADQRPNTKRVFQNLSAQIVATWGQFQEEGARACQPLVARSGHVHTINLRPKLCFSDSTKKRGRMAGQIWFVQHVSWMQGRERGVQPWFVRLMSIVQNQDKNIVIVLEKLFSFFLLSWKRSKGDKKFSILLLGLSSQPIGI